MSLVSRFFADARISKKRQNALPMRGIGVIINHKIDAGSSEPPPRDPSQLKQSLKGGLRRMAALCAQSCRNGPGMREQDRGKHPPIRCFTKSGCGLIYDYPTW
jgi:hypothetical protein